MDDINTCHSNIQAPIHPNKLRKRVHRACNGEEVKKTDAMSPGVLKGCFSSLGVRPHLQDEPESTKGACKRS